MPYPSYRLAIFFQDSSLERSLWYCSLASSSFFTVSLDFSFHPSSFFPICCSSFSSTAFCFSLAAPDTDHAHFSMPLLRFSESSLWFNWALWILARIHHLHRNALLSGLNGRPLIQQLHHFVLSDSISSSQWRISFFSAEIRL